MPFLALLEADLANRTRSWVMRIWSGLMVMLSLLTLPDGLAEGRAAEALAGLLGTFPLIWSTFVIIVSSGAISSEAGVVADSILSKAVTRYEYVLAKITSRLLTVLGLYLLVVLPPVYIILRASQDSLSGSGVAWAVLLVAMMLVLLTSMTVAFSALFNRTLAAIVVSWMLWYVASNVFALLGARYLAPLQIIDGLPDMLQGDYVVAEHLRAVIGLGGLACVFVLVAVFYFGRKDL